MDLFKGNKMLINYLITGLTTVNFLSVCMIVSSIMEYYNVNIENLSYTNSVIVFLLIIFPIMLIIHLGIITKRE